MAAVTVEAVYADGAGAHGVGWVELYVSGRHVADVPAVRGRDASPGDDEAVAVETVADLVGRALYILGHRDAYPDGHDIVTVDGRVVRTEPDRG